MGGTKLNSVNGLFSIENRRLVVLRFDECIQNCQHGAKSCSHKHEIKKLKIKTKNPLNQTHVRLDWTCRKVFGVFFVCLSIIACQILFRDFPPNLRRGTVFNCRLRPAWVRARVLLRHAMVAGHTTVALYCPIWPTRGFTTFSVFHRMRTIQRLKRWGW